MARQRVSIEAVDYASFADLVRRHRVAVVRQTARVVPGGGYRVQALVESVEMEALRAAGYRLEHHEDAEGAGRDRQVDVRTARALRAAVPVALQGRAAHYLDVDEVEAALAACAATNPGITDLLALPHATWEGRTCHALRMGGGAEGQR